MTHMTMVEAICDGLRMALQQDSSVLVLGQDVGKNGGVFRATEGLWQEFGDKRVIDTPLAESAMVGSALGLAISGLKPVVEIQFMGFIYPAFEQIVSHLARFHTRTQGKYTASIVIRAPLGGGVRAPELHSESTESLFAHIPGLKIAIPSTPIDAKGLLLTAIADPNPVLFLEPIRLYRSIREQVPEGIYQISFGKARIVHVGNDLTLIAWGSMIHLAHKVAVMAAEQGIFCEVIDLRTLNPLDRKTILQSVQKTGRAIIVHEAPKTAGFGAELAAFIQEQAFLYLKAPVQRVAGYDVPVPMSALEDVFLPNEERIMQAVQNVISF